jgi:hypothetical protein
MGCNIGERAAAAASLAPAPRDLLIGVDIADNSRQIIPARLRWCDQRRCFDARSSHQGVSPAAGGFMKRSRLSLFPARQRWSIRTGWESAGGGH